MGWQFDNSYARLPEVFRVNVKPEPVRKPEVVLLNQNVATLLGLELSQASESELSKIFAGNSLPEGSEPIAQAYAGHQFGSFTMLGDGRAILLGEQIALNGDRFDVQLKGSGPTPFSRNGDGRAALGPMLREYIISEAMFALGIPTTRSLAVVTTGEKVYRQNILPGAILTRIAQSHIRVGTFEYAAALQNTQNLKILADYTIARHYPELAESANPYLGLLRNVMRVQASLVAKWQLVGFVHGVMNTDNVSIAGETIDYGPCAFMNRYDPDTVFSSIDQVGRYAYGNQPQICQWNLVRFAECLIPLINSDSKTAISEANEVLQEFPGVFQNHLWEGMCNKLGLTTREDADQDLIQNLLDWMHEKQADFTNTFRQLTNGTLLQGKNRDDQQLSDWHSRWLQRLERNEVPSKQAIELMRKHNPAVIPRNHLVEEALTAASDHGDLAPMSRLLEVLARPYADIEEASEFCQVPAGSDDSYRTFCGT